MRAALLTAYASHVHNQPCSFQGGSHYLIDPAAAAGESNEIWLPLTTDATGVGFAQAALASHVARGDALSIVVHDPAAANAKMARACADLTLGSNGDLIAKGTFAAFAAAETVDQSITGTVQLLRKSAATDVTLNVAGLGAAAAYACHVHSFPCGVTSAGGHYKLDPTKEQNNELWPALGDTADSAATGLTTFAHRARLDAQSVVFNRGTAKVACANLSIESYPNVEVTGVSQFLPAATPDYTRLTATAQLVRGLDGMTSIHVAASGLTAGKTYPTHLHNRPCAVGSGGAHCLRDNNAATGESNEIWLPLEAAAGGTADARADFPHLPRRRALDGDPRSQFQSCQCSARVRGPEMSWGSKTNLLAGLPCLAVVVARGTHAERQWLASSAGMPASVGGGRRAAGGHARRRLQVWAE